MTPSFLTTTVAALLLTGSAAMAGPGGCGGRAHDVTAEAAPQATPAPEPYAVASAEPAPLDLDLLALLGGALPSTLAAGPDRALR